LGKQAQKVLDAQLASHLAMLAPGASTAERHHAACSSRIAMAELMSAPYMGPQASGTPMYLVRGQLMVVKVCSVSELLCAVLWQH
jgi:hypothetical protein